MVVFNILIILSALNKFTVFAMLVLYVRKLVKNRNKTLSVWRESIKAKLFILLPVGLIKKMLLSYYVGKIEIISPSNY